MNIIFFLFLSSLVLACPEGGTYHTNPDGSPGGLIGKNAIVNSGVFISPSAKVCDFAQVSTNSQILGNAFVWGYAKIGPFTVISDNARVGDQAQVSGTSNLLTEISGDSQVGGNSIISQGSKISGSTEIEGSPEIIRTKISGNSRVCKNYQILNEDINNSDFFCPELILSLSSADIRLIGIKENIVNQPKKRFRLVISQDQFSLEKKYVHLLINGVPVSDQDYDIDENYITVDGENYFVNGENYIQFSSRDNFGHEVVMPETLFYIAKETINIEVSSPGLSSDSAVLAMVKINNTFKEVEVKSLGNTLIVPDVSSFSSKIKLFVGSGDFIFGNVFEVMAIPSVIELIEIPRSSGFGNVDFSEGLTGWFINNQAMASQGQSESGPFLSLGSSSDGPVILSRQFNLSGDTSAISFEFSGNTLTDFAGNVISEGLDIFHYSKTAKKIYLTDFSPDVLEANSESQGGVREFKGFGDSYSIQGMSDEVISSLILYSNTSKISAESDTQIELKSQVPSFTTTFSLFNHNIYNIKDTDQYPPVLGQHGCGEDYLISADSIPNEKQLQFTFQENLEFLSVGSINSPFNPLFQNRIFGDLQIQGLKRKDIRKIEFEIKQGGKVIDVVPLGSCWKHELENSNQGEEEINFKHLPSLAHYLFQLDSTVLAALSPLKKTVFIPRITHVNGAVFSVIDYISKKFNGEKKNQPPLKPLAWLNLRPEYYEMGSLDYYNSSNEKMSRIGGEKWMHPSLVEPSNQMISFMLGWVVNDATKANGGEFNLPHGKTHIDGTDLDITFRNSFDLKMDINDPRLKDSSLIIQQARWNLGEFIKSSLNNISHVVNKVKDIYITVTRSENLSKPLEPSFQYVLDRFHASCIHNRFVDLVNPAKGRHTLLRNVPKHIDHLHVKFNNPDYANYEVLPIPPVTNSLEDLNFEIKDGKLDISSKYSSSSIAWKVSDSKYFTNSTKMYDFGSATGSKVNKNIIMPPYLNLNEDKYYYVDLVFADTLNGGCFARQFTFNSKYLCKSGKFSYKSEGSYSLPLFVSDNSVVSSYVIENGSGAVCGNSNLSGNVDFHAHVENMTTTVTPPATLKVGGRLKGIPSITVVPTFDAYIGGDFEGEISSTSIGNFLAQGKGDLQHSDQIVPWEGKDFMIRLDGKFAFEGIGWFYSNNYVQIKGNQTFSNYFTVVFYESSYSYLLEGIGTYNGYGMNDPYNNLIFRSFNLNGSASVTGPADIGGTGIYTSLSLNVKNAPDTVIRLSTGGGNVSVSGGKSYVDVNSKNFSMNHNCDGDVSVLIGDGPDGLNLNPEAENRRNFRCSYSTGSRVCDLAVPCFEPDKMSKL